MLIFIAVPTKGTVTDGKLNERFLKDLAGLHTAYPEHTFIAPMVQDYQLLPYMEVDATWEKWGHHCRTLIAVSDEVWVLMYEGWMTSTGVQAEITEAEQLGKPVAYQDVEYRIQE